MSTSNELDLYGDVLTALATNDIKYLCSADLSVVPEMMLVRAVCMSQEVADYNVGLIRSLSVDARLNIFKTNPRVIAGISGLEYGFTLPHYMQLINIPNWCVRYGECLTFTHQGDLTIPSTELLRLIKRHPEIISANFPVQYADDDLLTACLISPSSTAYSGIVEALERAGTPERLDALTSEILPEQFSQVSHRQDIIQATTVNGYYENSIGLGVEYTVDDLLFILDVRPALASKLYTNHLTNVELAELVSEQPFVLPYVKIENLPTRLILGIVNDNVAVRELIGDDKVRQLFIARFMAKYPRLNYFPEYESETSSGMVHQQSLF